MKKPTQKGWPPAAPRFRANKKIGVTSVCPHICPEYDEAQAESNNAATVTQTKTFDAAQSAQNNNLKGPYVADLKSKEIAPLLDPNHKPSDKDIVGNGQCVTACSKFSGVTGDTKRWRAGEGVADSRDIKPGTAIATFDGNARYPSGKDKNSGPYLGPGTKGSIWILDQWPAHSPNSAHPPQPREVLNDNTRGASNNANAYHVILVAPEE